MSTLGNYIRETRAELRHVHWPTRGQTAAFTLLVVLVSLATGAYLGLFDFLFSRLLRLVL